ncbi:hypothetical protein JTE90_007784 [Oedothorax gibbosus]|uniref:Uncharacterized protein n=1 Tax=Oedothorax gibbosus TaxID=931172 RepID=A0AAV6TRZ6_9ARAC|nr:hypothetical protein JTE90_007784 [Oedothorax gibbosus]
MEGKVIIVTGANSGVGFETAKDLARRKGRVILACRDKTRGTNAAESIIRETGNTNVVMRQLPFVSRFGSKVRCRCKGGRRTTGRPHPQRRNCPQDRMDKRQLRSPVRHEPFRSILAEPPLAGLAEKVRPFQNRRPVVSYTPPSPAGSGLG